jgi:hypothetical protein
VRLLDRPLRIAGSLVLAVAVVAFVVAAFVPRSDLTDASIAMALQHTLGSPTLVACDSSGDQWRCQVRYPSRPGTICTLSKRRRQIVAATYAPQASRNPCRAVPSAALQPTSYEVARGANDLIATLSPSEVERGIHSAGIPLKVAAKSFAQRVIEFLLPDE